MFRTLKKVSMTIIVLTFFCFNLALTNSPIYITQVQITGGKEKTNQDFVELFNPNSEAVNLKGYRLVKRTEQANKDTLIKSWKKDTFIPAKSFYLWANSNYSGTLPDNVSAATISEDNGVGLRFGTNDIGELVSSLSWGKASNGFKKVVSSNPVANQSIQRGDWYAENSSFFIGTAKPRNSKINDLSAEFMASQNKPVVKQAELAKKQNPVEEVLGTSTSTVVSEEAVENLDEDLSKDSGLPVFLEQPKPKNYFNKYFFVIIASFFALVFIVYEFVLKKSNK